MRKQLLPICAVLILTALACGSLSATEPTPTLFLLPTAPPQANHPTATPPPPTGDQPSLSPWPLPADLFYLTEAGQVWRQPYAGDESTAVAITRGDEKVSDFAVAPGGEWLLYRTEAGVSVMALDGTGGQVIAPGVGTPQDVTRGRTLAWSPDASRVAYATATGFQVYIPGAAADLQPLIFDAQVADSSIVALGWSGDARWLAAWQADGLASLCDTGDLTSLSCVDLGRLNGYAWLADGRLAFAPTEGGLAILDPGDLNSRTFMVGQDRQVDLITQRADGLLAFFVHEGGPQQVAYLCTGSADDLSFGQEGTAPIQTVGMTWDTNGERLIGPGEDGSIAVVDPASGAQGEIKATGTPVSFDWGTTPPRGVTSLPLPADLYFLAPQAGIIQVWRLPASGDPPETVTSAAAEVTAYTISADGTRIAYTSGGRIYEGEIGATAPKDIATIAPDANSPTGTPAYSREGDQLAFANNGIWVLDIESGEKRRLAADIAPADAPEQRQIFDQPRWSPDGRWLLARVTFYQGSDSALISTTGLLTTPILLQQYNSLAEWSADNTVLVYSDGRGFSQPQIARIEPGRTPVVTRLLALPVLDVAARPDGRLAFLRTPGPYALGPTTARIFSALPDGSDVRQETGSLALEEPTLSPEAVVVAGLVQTRRDDEGRIWGLLVIINPSTGQMFVLEDMPGVRGLRWGR